MNFPDYFPPDCPPATACAKEMIAYRFCSNNPIDNSDFRSYYQLGRTFSDNRGYGVSLITDKQELAVLSAMPSRRKKKVYIAKGTTCAECGVILETPTQNLSSHITWWLYENAEPEKYFNVLEDENNE